MFDAFHIYFSTQLSGLTEVPMLLVFLKNTLKCPKNNSKLSMNSGLEKFVCLDLI